MIDELYKRTDDCIAKSDGDSAVLEGLVRQSLNSWLSKAQQQKFTFDRGRAWMPEVERPKALHGRKANKAFIWQGRIVLFVG